MSAGYCEPVALTVEHGIDSRGSDSTILRKKIMVGVILMASVIFTLYLPALFLFLWLVLMASLPKSPNASIGISVVNILFIFGWMNIEKIPINDWAWYSAHYRWLETMPLGDYLGSQYNGMRIRWAEPVYHTISALVSRLSGGSVPVLAVVVTSIIYCSVAAGVAILVRGRLRSALEAMLVTWVPLCIGVTFTLSAQLVRQEISASLVFLGFALLWANRRNVAIFVIALGVLTHNSSVFPVLCISAAAWLVLKTKGSIKLKLPLIFFIGLALGCLFLLSPTGEAYYITQKDDGRVSAVVYIMDATILIGLVSLRARLKDFGMLPLFVISSVFAYSGFLLAVAPVPLLLLRMYFYMDFFRVAMLALIVCALVRSKSGWFWAFPFGIACLIYVESRIAVSPFYFGGGVMTHLLRPFAFFNS